MYESFYGFKEKPFNLTPDPDYLFMSQTHENAYTHLEYAVAENKGFVVITGEIGAGKTTLINFLLDKIQQDIHVGVINNTMVTPLQLLQMICQEFDLKVDGMGKTHLLEAFREFLIREFSEKKRVVLIIDEAQNLSLKTLEEIRMLSNLEVEKHHLIQILLLGQPELEKKLQRKGLEQFAQRVTVYCHLKGLAEDEASQYIRHRLKVAGAQSLDIFSEEAVQAIYGYSRGIPRIINAICDTALVYGYADEAKIINKNQIEEVMKSKKLGGIPSQDSEEERPATDPLPAAGEENDKVQKTIQALGKRVHLLEAQRAAAAQKKGFVFPASPRLRRFILDLLKLSKRTGKRVDTLEKRVQQLEGIIKGLGQRIYSDHKDDKRRDDLIIELLKMLKQNMEGRMETVSQPDEQREGVKGERPNSSPFAFLKRKK